MPPRRFDKNNSVTFKLVHRSQQDSRYHDPEASSSVLVPLKKGNEKDETSTKLKNFKQVKRAETVEQLKDDVEELMNEHEGKATSYGITFDDSEYNYMQHLKPIGEGDGIFIAKKEVTSKKDKYNGTKLSELFGEKMKIGEETKYDYTKQLDVPEEIKGFKPDLNPDLREVLVALDDENYLDGEQDIDEIDVFDELLGGEGKREELTLQQYDLDAENDASYYDEDEDWDYDNYIDGDDENGVIGNEGVSGPNEGNFNWEKDFAKYKRTKGKIVDEFDSDNEFSDDFDDEEDDFVGELPNIGEKELNSNTKSKKKNAKRKKGATTDTSSYSMSSSALCRTEQMTIIDDKFDVMKEKYIYGDEDDPEEEFQPFDLENERSDFMDMVDDFLDNYQLEKRGKRIVKKNEEMERYRSAALSVTKSKKTQQGTKFNAK